MAQSRKHHKRAEQAPAQTESKTTERDTTVTDEMLDEIDSVLETNAAEFVKSYVQKGGE